ncbi:uncharacterized protein LOC135946634 [Cloeon dipterum]|uniref:uncharacterized protein LOC135946634 n=1 Tax=Cloeon dipterum TaxID=197152 RepID=UPI00322034D4
MMRRRWVCTLLAPLCVLFVVLRSGAEEKEPESAPRLIVRSVVAYSAEAEHSAALAAGGPPRDDNGDGPLHAEGWLALDGVLFLLRAFDDRRVPHLPAVRLLSLVRGVRVPPNFFCRLRFHGRREVHAAKVLPTEIWSSEWKAPLSNTTFRPFLLTCPYKKSLEQPVTVSISLQKAFETTPRLPVVSWVKSEPSNQVSVAVCVKGLNFPSRSDDISRQIAEWIEINGALGASKFFVYVQKVDEKVQRLLKHYSDRVEVVDEPLPPGLLLSDLSELWQKRRFELVSYNDCLYRSIGRHQFVLPLDVDEVLVPVKHLSWQETLADLVATHDRSPASFAVRNFFFFSSAANTSPLDLLFRSSYETTGTYKSFAATDRTLTLFNHYALHTLIPGTQRMEVADQSVAQVNHYRQGCSPLMANDCQNRYLRFTQRDEILLSRVDKARVLKIVESSLNASRAV